MDRDHLNIHQEPGISVSTGLLYFLYINQRRTLMARRGRYQSEQHPSERRQSRLGSIAREEEWRTGRKTPGAMERAFNRLYPNRGYSTKTGPQNEDE
jgi:hypothetical protein